MDAKFKPQFFGDRCWKHGPESFGMFCGVKCLKLSCLDLLGEHVIQIFIVFIYIYMIYVDIFTYIHIYLYTYVHIYPCIYAYTYTYSYIYIHI